MLSLAKFIKKEIELRENLVGNGFIEPPSTVLKKAAKQIMQEHEEDMQHRVTAMGEIVSCRGMSSPNCYVMFEVLIPEDGWIFEDVNEFEIFGVVRDNTVEYNKRQSVTHISQGRVEHSEDLEDEDSTKFCSHFCFPFDYQFLAKDATIDQTRPYILI